MYLQYSLCSIRALHLGHSRYEGHLTLPISFTVVLHHYPYCNLYFHNLYNLMDYSKADCNQNSQSLFGPYIGHDDKNFCYCVNLLAKVEHINYTMGTSALPDAYTLALWSACMQNVYMCIYMCVCVCVCVRQSTHAPGITIACTVSKYMGLQTIYSWSIPILSGNLLIAPLAQPLWVKDNTKNGKFVHFYSWHVQAGFYTVCGHWILPLPQQCIVLNI